jgi:hypothetical protein
VWNSVEIASIQTSTINQADNYFAYPATIKHGRESLLRGYACVWYIVRMLAGLLPQTEASCVEIYVSKEN